MEEIKNDMFKAFDVLLDRFPSIGIRYEYSDKLECFLVSVDNSKLEGNKLDAFSDLVVKSIDYLQDKYGEDAPLFCINEEWFSLSPEALSYHKEKTRNFEWSDANVYKSIIRMRQLLSGTPTIRVSPH